nr:integrase, catalytic region, zinc finger, CCHC-type, peptidase aspartic, catalytic [Tanacetum cinerariifolium]
MKAVFTQMETKVAKCSVDKKYFEIEKNELSLNNNRLLEHILCQDVMNIVMHANDHFDNVLPANNNSLEHDNSALELSKHENYQLMELLISQDFVHINCISLEVELQQSKESFQDNRPSHNQDALEVKEFFIINQLQAQLKVKNISIEKLKEHIANIKGKNGSKVSTASSSSCVNFRSYKLYSGTVRFENDRIAKIMGYGDYHLRDVTILRLYYVEGLGHNVFSVGQFCDLVLEVAFRKHTCYVWNLDGDDLLSGSRDTYFYTILLDVMLKSSPICLLSKASKTKS